MKRRVYLDSIKTPAHDHPLQAGMTALAALTDLAAGPPKTLALTDKEIRRQLAEEEVHACELKEEARLLMEGWAYDPGLLSKVRQVDPLSLYLSLKSDHDERVQRALDQLVEKWS